MSLGKKILILIIGLNLYANVTSGVDKDYVTQGNYVRFHITVDAVHVKLPNISSLCGVAVSGTSTTTNINDINGHFKQTQTYVYSFSPQKTCIIKPISLKINGKVTVTQPIKITVHAPMANSDNVFSLNYAINNKTLYVGEPFVLTLKTKLHNGLGIVNSNFIPSPLNSNFWVLKQKHIASYLKEDYVNGGIIYLLSARKYGLTTIKPAKVSLAKQIARTNAFGSLFAPQLSWKQYVSNTLHVNIKPLPKGVDLVGNMKLSISVDRLKALANSPVNAVIKITGEGNFAQVPSLKPNISNIAIFANDAKIKYNLSTKGYHEIYTKKITFVADNNFTIPSITLKYFNVISKKIVILKTKPIKIIILGGSVITKKLQVVTAPKMIKIVSQPLLLSTKYLVIAFVVGLMIGILIMLLSPWKYLKKRTVKKDISLKDTRAIIIKLMKYKDNEEVQEMIEELEKKLYTSQDIVINMKKLKILKKRYNF